MKEKLVEIFFLNEQKQVLYLSGSVSDKKEDSSPLSNSYKEALEKNLIKLIDDEKDDNLYTLDAIDGQNKGRL